MDDKQGNKPLRTPSNKVKDLFNAYVKNEGSRNIPISDADEKKNFEESNLSATDNSTNSAIDKTSENSMNTYEMIDNFNERISEYESLLADKDLKIMEVEKERDDLRDQIIRKSAEFENFRKRSMKEKQDLLDYANEKLLSKMLVILDDMGKAIESANNSDDFNSILTGLNLIYQKSIKLFEESGVSLIQINDGEHFNVDLHEALMSMPSDQPADSILQVVQEGYMIKDKVLRHAKVITSSGND